jgi:hypothetical protein
MKFSYLCLMALLAAPVSAAPVHIALQASAAAPPNSDGFITLGSVASLSGGDKAARTRFAAVLVARAPLPGETRQLTRGDLALKLRQAGINPDTQAVLEGADHADVTTEEIPLAPTTVQTGQEGRSEGAASGAPTGSSQAPRPVQVVARAVLIHSGDAVTIYIQSGPMTITAPATARESGKAGDTIRVHRDGVMTDLSVQVLDAQTVQMEI